MQCSAAQCSAAQHSAWRPRTPPPERRTRSSAKQRAQGSQTRCAHTAARPRGAARAARRSRVPKAQKTEPNSTPEVTKKRGSRPPLAHTDFQRPSTKLRADAGHRTAGPVPRRQLRHGALSAHSPAQPFPPLPPCPTHRAAARAPPPPAPREPAVRAGGGRRRPQESDGEEQPARTGGRLQHHLGSGARGVVGRRRSAGRGGAAARRHPTGRAPARHERAWRISSREEAAALRGVFIHVKISSKPPELHCRCCCPRGRVVSSFVGEKGRKTEMSRRTAGFKLIFNEAGFFLPAR